MIDNSVRKRIFISHSSLDSELIDMFVDKVLCLGLNINRNDIAYTSREETGVPNGHNIIQYIKENISNCDIVFFMISDNYKKSEVCLNEMGAAWASERNIKIFILPEANFNTIGWLYSINRAARINDDEALDSIYDDFIELFDNKTKLAAWNRSKKEFLDYLSNSASKNLPVLTHKSDSTNEEEEMGLLDYRLLFDEHISNQIETLESLTTSTVQYSESMSKRANQLISLQSNPNPNIKQIKGVLMAVANDMNKMSDTIEQQGPKLKEDFSKVIEYGIKMHHAIDPDPQTTEDNRVALQGFVGAINTAKSGTIAGRRALNDIQNM